MCAKCAIFIAGFLSKPNILMYALAISFLSIIMKKTFTFRLQTQSHYYWFLIALQYYFTLVFPHLLEFGSQEECGHRFGERAVETRMDSRGFGAMPIEHMGCHAFHSSFMDCGTIWHFALLCHRASCNLCHSYHFRVHVRHLHQWRSQRRSVRFCTTIF